MTKQTQNNYVNDGESLDSSMFQKEHNEKDLFFII